jgi:hypothetical protein
LPLVWVNAPENGGPVGSFPGQVPYPNPNPLDHEVAHFGDYFPKESEPIYETPNDFLTNYTPSTPTIDPTAPSSPDFTTNLQAAARQYYATDHLGDAAPSKYYFITVYQNRRIDGGGCATLGCGLWKGYLVEKTYQYWWNYLPSFSCYHNIDPICDGAGCPDQWEEIDFHGATPTFISPWLGKYLCGGGFFTATLQSDNPDGSDPEEIMTIPPPTPPIIPDGIPVPPVPLRAPPPVILTGSVSTVDPPLTAQVSVTNNGDGTATVNYQFVCCPGPSGPPGVDGAPGADGITPTFSIGTVVVVPIADTYVTITGGPDAYVLNFGIPNGDALMLNPVIVPVSVYDETTNTASVMDVTMYAASDGTHDQKSFITAIFNQFAQMRNNQPVAQLQLPIEPAIRFGDGQLG